jgi:hypothetical protein
MAADQWAQGVASRLGFMSVGPAASCTRVYMRRGRPKRWRKSVEAESLGELLTYPSQ